MHNRSKFVEDEITKERDEKSTRLMMATIPERLCYGDIIYDESGDVVDISCTIVNKTFETYAGVRIGSLQGHRFYRLNPDQPAEAHRTIMSGINYASKIQQNILPKADIFKQAFSDYSVIWKPCDIVGGDIFWIKSW